jgi:hypothetical protein
MHAMRKIFLSVVTLLYISNLCAQQQRTVTGKLTDSVHSPIARATVILFYETPGDTLRSITNTEGIFQFQGVKSRPFFLRTTHLGFSPFEKKIENEALSINLPTFILTPSFRTLEEIIIETPPIQVKEDTVEYKADSFKVKPNAMVEDLLRKLPGVSVDKDGNVTAQGKQVTRVKVNGKDFFQGDVKTATRELSADMIDKVQVVDDYGDQSALSGIRDGEPEKVINLQLKKDKNKGVFGRATAGYGTNDRYQASVNANYFNNNKQLSLFANSNNVNNSLFNIGGNTGGGQGFTLGGNGGGTQAAAAGGGNVATVLQAAGGGQSSASGSDGISTTHSIGTNFRNDFTGSHKGSIYGSYSFTRRMTDAIKDVSQQNIFETASFTNNQNSKTYNQSNNHRFNFNFEYSFDSFNYVKIIPQISYSESNNQGNSAFSYFNEKNIATTEGSNRDSTLSNTPNLSLNVLYNLRFRKRGRNFSVNANVNSSSSESDKYTENITNNLSIPVPVEVRLRQRADQENLNQGVNLRFNYSEPIARDRFVDLIYGYRKTYTKNDKKTYGLGTGLPVFNPLLSNAFENDFDEQRIGANIRTVKKKYNYTLGISVQPVTLKGNSITKDSAYTPQHRVNIFPVARFGYNFTRTRSFNANYSGNARQPSFSQLQPVRDISNLQYQYQGNPGLRPERTHSLNLIYNNFNFQSGKVLFTGVNASLTQDKIVDNNIRLTNSGAQLTIPENVNGYYNVSAFYNWSKPFQNRRYIFTLNGLLNYNHIVALADSLKNIGRNVLAAQGLVFEYNPKEWLEVDFGVRYSVNATKYSLPQQQSPNFNSWTLTSNSRVDFPGGLIFRYDFQYIINNGLAESVSKDIALLNASLEKTLFKKKNGFLRLSGYDIFKQNTNISRTVTGNNITDSRINRLTRYFMLSFTYRLNRFQGQQSGNRQPVEGGRQMRIINQ